MDKIKVYDTTLRDGMQAEGICFSLEDKLAIARHLDDLGFDYIEGGYPASNQKEAKFFAELARKPLKNAKVVAFGSTRRADNTCLEDTSLNSLIASKAPVATMVGKSWDLHVTEVLGCSLDENLIICAESVKYIKKHGMEAFFDAEHFFDGYKRNPAYTMKVIEAAANAGADAIILCDTNGGCLPEEIYEITSTVKKALPDTVIGIHCHNDTDCATANSIAAVRAGATQVQGTINGLGERCGNANLCVVIPNIAFKTKKQILNPAKIQRLTESARFIAEISNLNPPVNMPYVGSSAFAHKAGLHVNALRKNQTTYEHITPDLVGNERRFLISELSGKSNILAKLDKANLGHDKDLAKKVLEKVQDLENKGFQFEAADASFDLLVKKIMGSYTPFFQLIKYRINVEMNTAGELVTEAAIKLRIGDNIQHVVGEGAGPVNALDAAMRKSLENSYPSLKEMRLIDYKVRVVNGAAGTAAKVRVFIESRDKEDVWGTVGASENIVEASWQALVDSIDYKLYKELSKTS